jgi:hypothetical protein
MTAPKCKQPITPEIVERFAAYYRDSAAWGLFHVSLDDNNWTPVPPPYGEEKRTEEEHALVAIFNALTQSQRRRLRRKAEALSAGRGTVAA